MGDLPDWMQRAHESAALPAWQLHEQRNRPMPRQMRAPEIRARATNPGVRRQAEAELNRRFAAEDDPRTAPRLPRGNQFAEAGAMALEGTGLPSIRRGAAGVTRGAMNQDPMQGLGQVGAGAVELGLGGLGVAGLGVAPRMAPRLPARLAPPGTRIATPREQHIARYWNEDWRTAERYTAGDPNRGSANDNMFRVIENPTPPEPMPRMTPPPREIAPNGMTIRPPEPFRNSLRGGSEDLAEAAQRQPPMRQGNVAYTREGDPSDYTQYEWPDGALEISNKGTVNIIGPNGRTWSDGSVGSGEDALRVFRPAFRALAEDVATHARDVYRFQPETPRQAAMYRSLLSNRTPEGYRLVEIGKEMRLERIRPPQAPDAGDITARAPTLPAQGVARPQAQGTSPAMTPPPRRGMFGRMDRPGVRDMQPDGVYGGGNIRAGYTLPAYTRIVDELERIAWENGGSLPHKHLEELASRTGYQSNSLSVILTKIRAGEMGGVLADRVLAYPGVSGTAAINRDFVATLMEKNSQLGPQQILERLNAFRAQQNLPPTTLNTVRVTMTNVRKMLANPAPNAPAKGPDGKGMFGRRK